MRFCEIISESFLTELNKGIFDEMPYKGFIIKFTTKPHFENGTQFGAVGIDRKGGFIGDTKPQLANTKEEAIQIVMDMIDSDIEVRHTTAKQNSLSDVLTYSMNFNTKFTKMMPDLFNTYVKIYKVNGVLVLEIASPEFTEMFNSTELRNEGFYLLHDRKSSKKEGDSFQRPISKRTHTELDLVDRGRYIIINNNKISNNDNPLYDLEYLSQGNTKHDKEKIPGPGFSIATTVKGGQD